MLNSEMFRDEEIDYKLKILNMVQRLDKMSGAALMRVSESSANA